MFPVTRQVRRKRTPVFGRPGRTRGARMRARRAEETAHRGRARAEAAQRPGSGRSKVGSASEKRLRERAASSAGEARAGERAREGLGREQGRARGDREVPDKQNAPLAPGRSGRPCGTVPIPWEGPPAPPGNQRCDPAGPAAVAEMPGPIRWDTVPSWSPHNPRTPACA